MKRRTVIIGAGGVLIAGGAISASGASNLLAGPPSEVQPTAVTPGTLDYSTAGVERLRWGKGQKDRQAELRVEMADVAPQYMRLHDADGRKRWEAHSPGEVEQHRMGVPFESRGDWELAVDTGGSWTSLVVPMDVRLQIDRFALDGDQLNVEVSNPTQGPNYLQSVKLFDGPQIHSIARPQALLLPGESWSKAMPYPAESYRDVKLHVSDRYAGYVEWQSFV